uniref:Integrase core domain-containing protein n=1 Tax=Amphimedon queenslandica TaxID=400682 RepID=A0A1X7UVF2_AMPQE
ADHPDAGEVMINGHLRSKGIRIPRSRIRASVHRLDPFVRDRLKPAIRRCSYHVPGPNYVWHIDGNQKLIRWRIVIHGGIDGYYWVVVFLKPSTDNHAHMMLSCFENGVFEYGLPTHIRLDLGGENVEVWRYM